MGSVLREHLDAMSDEEISQILKREYTRKLIRYKNIDDHLSAKYLMTYEEFEANNIIAEKGSTWEVEKDAEEWETAIDGMQTMKEKLAELSCDA